MIDTAPFPLVVEDPPDPADLTLLEEHVAAAAIAAAAVGADRPFGIFLRDENGAVVAGISGMTWAGCCELHAMWVAEPLRGRGLARQLMAEAESVALAHGASLITFFAYDLLVEGLYERLGYGVIGTIDDLPSGSAARWYCKHLSGSRAGANSGSEPGEAQL